MITNDIMLVLEAADFYKRGLPPVAGGVRDQSVNFTNACRFIWHEQDHWRAKLGITSLV